MAASVIKSLTKYSEFDIAIICGSGLKDIGMVVSQPIFIDYSEIPGLVNSNVHGHFNKVVVGQIKNKVVICFESRVHLYEKASYQSVVAPIALISSLNVKTLFITNSSGGLNSNYKIGDIMQIIDQINVPGFCGHMNSIDSVPKKRSKIGKIYCPNLVKLCQTSFERLNMLDIYQQGIYSMVMGPAYDTNAESNMLRDMGTDAVGASTVHEAIVATEFGIKVCGLSVITAISDRKNDDGNFFLKHEDVVEMSSRRALEIGKIIKDMATFL